MIRLHPVKKIGAIFLIFILPVFVLTFQSCKKKRSEMANELFKKTHNKIFRNVTPEGFSEVFKQVFWKEKSKLNHPFLILGYYQKNDYTPEFVMDHLFNGDLAK